LAQRQNEAANTATREPGVRVHGAHARRLGGRIQQGRVASGRMTAAVQRGPPAPSPAACDLTIDLDHEVRAIVDQLHVEPHDRSARLDLGVVEEAFL
jgi:hypothetical protein